MMQTTVWDRPAVREDEHFYRVLPGVDLSSVAAAKMEPFLKRLNARRCTCACMRTVAGCRNHHSSCNFSLAVAKEAVDAASR